MTGMVVPMITFALPVLAAAEERGSYVALDREGTASAVGIDASATFADGLDVGLRQGIWGRYVSSSGIGAYGQFAVSQLFLESDSHAAISNLELGGSYVTPIRGLGDLTLRFGVVLPIESGHVIDDFITNGVGSVGRLEDFALILPDAVFLRPAVGLRFGDRAFFGQLSLGVDVAIPTVNGGSDNVIIHGGIGVGTTQGPIALTAELATVAILPGGVRHNLGFSIRYVKSDFQPYVAYVLPFQLFDDDFDHVYAHVAMVGVQGTF